MTDDIHVANTNVLDIHLTKPDGSPLVTIHANGNLKFAEGIEPTEAARAFWQFLDKQIRTESQAARIITLEHEIRAYRYMLLHAYDVHVGSGNPHECCPDFSAALAATKDTAV